MTITLFEQSNYIRGPSNKQIQFDIKHFVKDKQKQILYHFLTQGNRGARVEKTGILVKDNTYIFFS